MQNTLYPHAIVKASKRDAKTDASKPSLDNALSLLADELAKAQSKSTDLENLAQQLVQIRTYIEKVCRPHPRTCV